MAEIGLIASVVQVAGAGLKLSNTLYQYVDGVATADRRIKDIATEIRLTSFVIEELGNVFKSDETKTLISKGAVKTADETMKECSDVFAEIDATLKKSKKNTFGRLMLPFRDSKIELLRSHIDKLKDTLTLLLGVLSIAHHVATKKLDRKAEAEAKAQIQELIELKKKSAKKYEESLKNFSISDGSSQNLSDDADAEIVQETVQVKAADDGASAPLSIMAIASSINPQSLETCVQHVRSLLDSIETLQQALTSAVDGRDHSTHHQSLIDSYFRARGHLDGVIFRGLPQQNLVTDTKSSAELAEQRSLSSGSASAHDSARTRPETVIDIDMNKGKVSARNVSVSTESYNRKTVPDLHDQSSSEGAAFEPSGTNTLNPAHNSPTIESRSNPVVIDVRHRLDNSSSSSSGINPNRGPRIVMTSRTENEIRLRVDRTMPLDLESSGDKEGRTLQLAPAESGMSDMVIGGDGSHSSGTINRSERGSVTSKSRSAIAGHRRREAEDVSERSSRSSRLRRSKRIVEYPSETMSQRSDPNPYFSPTSAQGPQVVQMARTRRASSTAGPRPQRFSGDPNTFWAPEMPEPYPSPAARGPPPDFSYYQNYCQNAHTEEPSYYPPGHDAQQYQPFHAPHGHPISTRPSTIRGQREISASATPQEGHSQYSARYVQAAVPNARPSPSQRLPSQYGEQDSGESSGSENPEGEEDEREVRQQEGRAARALVPPPELRRNASHRLPSLTYAKTTQVVEHLDTNRREKRRQAIMITDRAVPRERRRERERVTTSDAAPLRRPSVVSWDEDDDDGDNLPPPSFSALKSAQRAAGQAPTFAMAPLPEPNLMAAPMKPTVSSLMPPPRVAPSNLRALTTSSQRSEKKGSRKSITISDSEYDQRAYYGQDRDRTAGGEYDAERRREKRSSKVIIHDRYMSSLPKNDDDNDDDSEEEEGEEDDAWALIDPRENMNLMNKAKEGVRGKDAELNAEEYINATRGSSDEYADAINKTKRVKSTARKSLLHNTGKDATALLPTVANEKYQAQVQNHQCRDVEPAKRRPAKRRTGSGDARLGREFSVKDAGEESEGEGYFMPTRDIGDKAPASNSVTVEACEGAAWSGSGDKFDEVDELLKEWTTVF